MGEKNESKGWRGKCDLAIKSTFGAVRGQCNVEK